jgi:conjugative relaxase-like TrwC/TraI family protein
MSLFKLTAGDGYTYLIRQVAASDSTERGYQSLGDYYEEAGESAGRWWGAGLDSLGVSGRVTEEQMRALFGEGRHPNADTIEAQLIKAGYSPAAAMSMTRLGQKFKVTEGSTEWQRRLAAAYAQHNTAQKVKWDTAIPEPERARIRTEVAGEFFQEVYGRSPLDGRELTGFIARESRTTSTAVAGYDLTFSPVKSISALWAIAPQPIRDAIRHAHEAAVERSLLWLQQHAAYTRVGDGGPAQVETRGLLVAVFTHRDSRNGDPQLHTHAAVSNKVQTRDGRWLALDGRVIHELAVSASEFYNTAIEEELTARIGGRFAEVTSRSGRRTTRELVGVDPQLSELYSSRSAELVERSEQLAADFFTQHGRQPTPLEMIHLAQRANLETRQAKHQPRIAADQHQLWRFQAGQALGADPETVGADQARAARVAIRSPGLTTDPAGPISEARLRAIAEKVMSVISFERSSWQWRHVYAEAQRQLRTEPDSSPELRMAAIAAVTDRVLGAEVSVPIGQPIDTGAVAVPSGLRRSDGSSVFTRIGGQRYTSAQVLAAEQRILTAAGLTGGRVTSATDLGVAVLEWQANDTGRRLNSGQEHLADQLARSGRRVQLALAPAGTGKTTALGILASAWTTSGGQIVALAPQASAAHQLSRALGGAKSDTLDKLVHEVLHTATDERPDWVQSIGEDTLVLIDEAGLASTRNLDVAINYVLGRGGSVRLIGDDRQLGAVAAGGLLRDLQAEHGALTLTEVMRFTDKVEGAASLALRTGDPGALGYYLDRGRIHATTTDAVADQVFNAAQTDAAAGADVLMIAPDLQLVAALNARARAVRLERDGLHGAEVGISGGETASAGDRIITKKNNRRLSLGGTDHVKNNDRFTITQVHDNGSVDAVHIGLGRQVRLPAWYVKEHVRLGYAATLRSEQGDTVGGTPGPDGPRAGITHTVITSRLGAAEVYMGMTRGTSENHAWVVTAGDGEAHSVIRPEIQQPATAVELLTQLLARDDENRSATTELAAAADPARQLFDRAGSYRHAYNTAVTDLSTPARLTELTAAVEQLVPGVSTAPAWDSLLAHLAGLDLTGADPIAQLADVITDRELSSAQDVAAVLTYRLDPNGTGSLGAGPLPWLPSLPAAVSFDDAYGPYLRHLATEVRDLVDQITTTAASWSVVDAPAWALPYLEHPDLIGRLAVWRAATGTDPGDLRPAGPAAGTMSMRRHRGQLLDQALAVAGVSSTDAAARWSVLINQLDSRVSADESWPLLAGRLNTADALGVDVDHLLRAAFDRGPLPDERPADALWWRIAPHLNLTGAQAPVGSYRARPPWTTQLTQILGEPAAERIMADRLWPAIVARMDLAIRQGGDPDQLARDAAGMLASHLTDLPAAQLATATLWQLSLLADPEPLSELEAEHAAAVPDEHDDELAPPDDAEQLLAQFAAADLGLFGDLLIAGDTLDLGEPAGEDLVELVDPALVAARAALADAAAFYTAQVPGSWAPDYLTQRGLPGLQAGHAPPGWTTLIDRLRRTGHTDQALLDAGLAKISSRGTLIDTFRDRLVLPITEPDGSIVSFLGRRNPAHESDPRIPKYLNGPTTDLYNKSALPYGLDPDAVAAIATGAPIVLVEGPFDAAAIRAAVPLTTAVPVAATGTALTDQHLQLLASIHPLGRVITGFDNDNAGRAAAVRAHQLLADAGVTEPLRVDLPLGVDPAELLATHGPAALADAIANPQPLLDLVVDQQLATGWPFHPPADDFEHQLLTGQAMWRTVENTLLHEGQLLPGPAIARQTHRIAVALNRPVADVVDALGACAFPDDWAGIDPATFDPDYWLHQVELIGEFAFTPYLGDPTNPAGAEDLLTEFRDHDPTSQPTTEPHNQKPNPSGPSLRERYQQALADYLTARDDYHAASSRWHHQAAHEHDRLYTRTDPRQTDLDTARADLAAALDHQRTAPAGDTTASDQVATAQAALQAAQTAAGATDQQLAAETTGHANQQALRDLAAVRANLQQLQTEIDHASPVVAPVDAEQRWQDLVAGIHPDLVTDPHYPRIAEALDRAHNAGIDMHTLFPAMVDQAPTTDAREILWRLYVTYEQSMPDLDTYTAPDNDHQEGQQDVEAEEGAWLYEPIPAESIDPSASHADPIGPTP